MREKSLHFLEIDVAMVAHNGTRFDYLNDQTEKLVMSEFTNVTIVKQANVYFDGKVSSRTIKFQDGTTKTLGFMLPGEYTFNTAAPETMEILAGEMTVQLPGSDDWQPIVGGESFDVPGNAAFSLRVTAPTDYCCSFNA